MIRIGYTPQAGLPGKRLAYSWSGRVLTAQLVEEAVDPGTGQATQSVVAEEQFDFGSLQPGDRVTEIVPKMLTFSPVVSAEVDDTRDLHVALLYWYGPGDPTEKAEEVLDG